MIWNAMRKRRISGRTFAAIVAVELIVVTGAAWVAAGVPGLTHDGAPPSVTIQFAPLPAPNAISRSYKI
jgi:hypothetical protein